MSANEKGDKIRIPIEIKLDDSEEIRELLNDIDKAESQVRTTLPRRGVGSGDTGSRSAFDNGTDDMEGIFGGSREGDALPSRSKDKSSRQPMNSRENQFKKMQEDVANVKKEQLDIKAGLGVATQGVGFASLIARGGAGGFISGIASKAFLPLAIATIVIELVHSLVTTLLSPGGPFDRRWKRDIAKEVSSATSREDKLRIAQGLAIIRVTTSAGFRGTAFSGNTDALLRGEPIYDQNMELRAKGFY